MRPARPYRTLARPILIAVLLMTHAWTARAAENGRLDRDVRPKFQTVRLELDPARPDYSGTVHIDFTASQPRGSIQLHALGLDVIRVRLTSAGSEVPTSFEPDNAGHLIVRPESSIAPGDYSLDIDFRNDFDVRANGLYRLKSGTDWYCFTQFEANAAREAFPCWDEPEFKIPYQITLSVPAGDAAVSNTPIEKETTVGGVRTVVFARTPPLPSYLVALAVGPFEFVPIRGMSVPGRVVTVKGSSRLAGEAARVTPLIVGALEKYFQRPYPYAKLDLIAVPEFSAGAMENAGAITFREDVLLIDPAASSARQRFGLASTTAHEVAHMWFGDLVTMEWWDDLWLNESFAAWMGTKIVDELFPRYHASVQTLNRRRAAMETDARPSTRPIRQAVDASDDVDRLFDELSYSKGQAVLGMIEKWLGPEAFRAGVRDYLKAHEWKTVTAADLWRALSTASGKDVGPVATSFLDQGGVPLVSAELEPGGKLVLKQRRFLNDSTATVRATTWTIPVTLKVSDGRREFSQTVLLDQPEQTVTLAGATAPVWVHPNAGESGYYRWWVPPDMLEAIAAGATRSLDTRERVGFMANLSALLDAGRLRGDAYLRTVSRFSADPEPEVIGALIDALDKVYDTCVIPAVVGPYAIVVKGTLRPALDRFGMTPRKDEPEPVSLLRPRLLEALGVRGNDRDVMAWAGLTARRYLDHPETVDASIAGAALNLAAREGDAALFDEYRVHFENARVPADRSRYLTGLGHFRVAPSVDKALDYALLGPLRPQEVLVIPRNIAEDDASRDAVWRWFTQNHRYLVKKIPTVSLSNLPSFASCCVESRIAEATSFFSSPAADLPGTRDELAKVVDRIRDCARLRARESQAIANYASAAVRAARAARTEGSTPAPQRAPGGP